MLKARDLVKAYEVKKGSTLVVVIPKSARAELKIKKGCRFLVKPDIVRRTITYKALD